MTVRELIEMLKQMPQDARVEIGVEAPCQTEPTVVSLQETTNDVYVFIGDY